MSASWVKVGLSLRSYAQQAERISWDDKPIWVSAPGKSLSRAHTGLLTMNDDDPSETELEPLLYKQSKHVRFLKDWHTCASVSTHSDLLAQADLRQNLLYALSAPHLPDGSFHRLIGDWPVPSLKLIPNGA